MIFHEAQRTFETVFMLASVSEGCAVEILEFHSLDSYLDHYRKHILTYGLQMGRISSGCRFQTTSVYILTYFSFMFMVFSVSDLLRTCGSFILLFSTRNSFCFSRRAWCYLERKVKCRM